MPFHSIKNYAVRSRGTVVYAPTGGVSSAGARRCRCIGALGRRTRSVCDSDIFADGTLKFESTSAVAMQQFRVDEVRILNEINRRCGSRRVVRLDVRSKGF